MKKFFILVIILILVAIGGFWFWQTKRVVTVSDVISLPMKKIVLKSSAFEDNSNIPPKYTCDGEDINPPLSILDIPEDAQSLVLIVDDPDAPMGTFYHWTVWNISPQTSEISENSVPESAVEGKTDFGKTGYGGPCPPSGAHRYFFKVFALDVKLNLPAGASRAEIEKAMERHILGKAELIGLYSRP